MLDMYSDNSYFVVPRLLHVYTFSVLEVLYKLKLQKAALYMYKYPEGELYNWRLTYEVILYADNILWFTKPAY
jgi:hypothetical protein